MCVSQTFCISDCFPTGIWMQTREFSSSNIIWVEINPWVQWKPLKQLISSWDSRNMLAQESWFGHFPGLGGPNKKIDPKELYQDWKSERNLFLVQYPWISYVLNLACISWKILAQESCFEHFPGLGASNKKIDSKEVSQDWKSGGNLFLVQYPQRSYVLMMLQFCRKKL